MRRHKANNIKDTWYHILLHFCLRWRMAK